MSKIQKVLAIAAHPDDEILGCGATLKKHHHSGDQVYSLILAEGLTSRDKTRNQKKRKKELSQLIKAAQVANKVVGSKLIEVHHLPDNRLDTIPLLDIIKIVEHHINNIKPNIIYTHFPNDLNVDHQITYQAVITACRPLPNNIKPDLYCFEVCSATEWQSQFSPSFNPNHYVDISQELKSKIKALKAYDSEMRPWPHARSYQAVEHLAKLRGAQIGVEAAESFMVERQIR